MLRVQNMMRAAQFTNSFPFFSHPRWSKVIGFTGVIQKALPLTHLFVVYGYVSDDTFVEGFVFKNAHESQFAAELWRKRSAVNSFFVFCKYSFNITRKQTNPADNRLSESSICLLHQKTQSA